MKNTHIHTVHQYSKKELSQASSIFFGTLVSEQRLHIIQLLRKNKLAVNELMHELAIEQSALSHDLARLRKCGFVTVQQKGKYRVYALAEDIRALMHLIDEHMKRYCVHIVRSEKK